MRGSGARSQLPENDDPDTQNREHGRIGEPRPDDERRDPRGWYEEANGGCDNEDGAEDKRRGSNAPAEHHDDGDHENRSRHSSHRPNCRRRHLDARVVGWGARVVGWGARVVGRSAGQVHRGLLTARDTTVAP